MMSTLSGLVLAQRYAKWQIKIITPLFFTITFELGWLTSTISVSISCVCDKVYDLVETYIRSDFRARSSYLALKYP